MRYSFRKTQELKCSYAVCIPFSLEKER